MRSDVESVFNEGEDIEELICDAASTPPIKQGNGRLARTVDAGRDIGFDQTTNQMTQKYTVITEPDGLLVTAFPGLPLP